MGWKAKRPTQKHFNRVRLELNPGRGEREMERAVAALGFPYQRQRPIGRYFADLAVEELRLVVEVDGAGHGGQRDKARDAQLASMGWTTVRVPAAEAKRDPVAALFAVLPATARAAALRNTDRQRLCAMIRDAKPNLP